MMKNEKISVQVNEKIKAYEVRVIDFEGNMLGIYPISEALKLAKEKDLDLINVSPASNPPVCRLYDYGKYKYEMQKREKETKKKQVIIETKEVRLSPFIEEHDLKTKATAASKFLKAGDKVKVSLRLRGRERDYANHAKEVMIQFANDLSDISILVKEPIFEGRGLMMILEPKKK